MIIYENNGSYCTLILGKNTLEDSHSLHFTHSTIKSGHHNLLAYFCKQIFSS